MAMTVEQAEDTIAFDAAVADYLRRYYRDAYQEAVGAVVDEMVGIVPASFDSTRALAARYQADHADRYAAVEPKII
jgi:hypothetical protein